MNLDHSAITVVVKRMGDDEVHTLVHPRDVKTLAERIRWIQHQLGGISQRELARRAGLADAHVGTLMGRLKKNPTATVETETLLKLAQAANVSPAWLAKGEGAPYDFASPLLREAASRVLHRGKTLPIPDAVMSIAHTLRILIAEEPTIAVALLNRLCNAILNMELIQLALSNVETKDPVEKLKIGMRILEILVPDSRAAERSGAKH